MKKPCEILKGRAQFTRREGGQGAGRLGNFFKIFLKKFFSGFYYRVAGGGYFTTFWNKILKIWFAMESWIELNKDMREV